MTWIMIKKEAREAWRSRRFLILLIVFLIFGLMNPLMAKLTPEIMKMSFGKQFSVPTPTSLDSWTQFYKNNSQIGIYLLAIIFGGTVSGEVNRGTLVNLVTKGLPRRTVIVSKWLVITAEWVLVALVSFLVTWGYTAYYFPDQKSPHLWLAFLPLLLFGCSLTALIVLASTLARNSYEGLFMVIGYTVILYLLSLFADFKHYNPLSLINHNLTFLTKAGSLTPYWPAMLVTGALGVLALLLANLKFARKQL
ncbi:ABC transporter permease [Lapidilactobacillus salsurivasis]